MNVRPAIATNFIGRGRKRGLDISAGFERGNGAIGEHTGALARGVLTLLALAVGSSPEAVGTFLLAGSIPFDGKRDMQATFDCWTTAAKSTVVGTAGLKSFSLTPTRSSVYFEANAACAGYIVGDLRITADSKTADDNVALRVVIAGHLDDTTETEEFIIYGQDRIRLARPLVGLKFHIYAGTETDQALPSGSQVNVNLIASAKLLDEDTADVVREVTATVHGRDYRERLGSAVSSYVNSVSNKVGGAARAAAAAAVVQAGPGAVAGRMTNQSLQNAWAGGGGGLARSTTLSRKRPT